MFLFFTRHVKNKIKIQSINSVSQTATESIFFSNVGPTRKRAIPLYKCYICIFTNRHQRVETHCREASTENDPLEDRQCLYKVTQCIKLQRASLMHCQRDMHIHSQKEERKVGNVITQQNSKLQARVTEIQQVKKNNSIQYCLMCLKTSEHR